MDQNFTTSSTPQEKASTTVDGSEPNINTSPKPGVISGGGAGGGRGGGVYDGGSSEFSPLAPLLFGPLAPFG